MRLQTAIALVSCTFRPAAIVLALCVASACAGEIDGEALNSAAYDDDELGMVQLELRSVPSGTRCVRVAISNGTAVVRTFDLSAGQSTAALDLGRLALGTTSFTATAYNLVCSSVTNATIPDWLGAPVTAVVLAGINPAVAVTLVPNVSTTIAVDFKQPVTKLVGGMLATFALLPGGSVHAWGSNTDGVLADGTTTSRLTPAPSPLLTNVATLDASTGMPSACAVTTAGALRCWGNNANGQLGDGTTTARSTPVTALASDVTSVTHGLGFTCVVRTSDARALCAGLNNRGQLGRGNITSRELTFQPVVGSTRFTQLDASASGVCGLSEAGQLSCWGENMALGSGSSSGDSPSPATNLALMGLVELAFGRQHYCGLRGDGAVMCWGLNQFGQLGDGSTTNRFTPDIVPNVSDAVQLVATDFSTCARLRDGAVKCWGANMNTGAVGDGSGANQLTPINVRNLSGVLSIAAGDQHVCAQLSSGDLQCWGDNAAGQLGDGTTILRLTPTSVRW